MFHQRKYHFIGMLLLFLAGIPYAFGEDCPSEQEILEAAITDLPYHGYTNENAILPLTILFSHSNSIVKPEKKEDSEIEWKLLPESVSPRETGRLTCMPTPSKPRIKDFLAQALSGFNTGKNSIIGQCFGEKDKECFIRISHFLGDSAYGYDIRFKTKGDKIIMDSFFCLNTP